MKRIICTSVFLLLVIYCGPGCKKPGKSPVAPLPTVQTTPWPEWIFHHWIWIDGNTSSAEAMVQGYLQNKIPVAAIELDSDWETDYNTFNPDSNYSNLPALIAYMHSNNIKVLFWITGIIDTNVHPLYDYADSNHFFMQANATSGPAIISWWHGYGSIIDWYNPAAVTWWKGMMNNMINLGIDGWKCDGTDYYSAEAPYSPYLGTTMPSRNDYSAKYYQLFFDYTRQQLGNDRAIMCRPIDNYGYGFGGSAVAFCPPEMGFSCWVGDQAGTFAGLTAALNNMYYSGQYGYLGFGSDNGGYITDPNYASTTGRSKTVFIRWAQLGAFSGLMENGGGGDHEPWEFDQQTTTIYQEFVLLREQMVPYLMKTATACYGEHQSMMNFFNQTNYSYLLGNDIFVAPLLDETGNATINFPAGNNWIYLFNKTQTYNGGTTTTLNFPINEFPVYLRQGAVLVDSLNPS